jgi:hypothetical protein
MTITCSRIPQPPNSLDLATAEFSFFLKLKFSLKVLRFQTVEEIGENSTLDLRASLQNMFQNVFQNWKNFWERGIKEGGGCFEGDKFD